jgi:hypothetical protein
MHTHFFAGDALARSSKVKAQKKLQVQSFPGSSFRRTFTRFPELQTGTFLSFELRTLSFAPSPQTAVVDFPTRPSTLRADVVL